jgi:hypothetical protein
MVTDELSPYQRWLRILTDSPDYYELLGLTSEEPDRTRIALAADRAIARVRGHRPGSRAAEWARLLDELRLIKQTLTDPVRKQEYDETLRKKRKSGVRKQPDRGEKSTGNRDSNDSQSAGGDGNSTRNDELVAPSSTGPQAISFPPIRQLEDELGIDLSYLSPPPARSPKDVPPKIGLAKVTDDKLDRVDDIVLPPMAASAPPEPTPSVGEPLSMSRRPVGRGQPALLPARKKQKGLIGRIFGGAMTCVLVAAGVYAFVYHEEPPPREGPSDRTETTPVGTTLLTEEQRVAILEENARRERDAGERSDGDSEPVESAEEQGLDVPHTDAPQPEAPDEPLDPPTPESQLPTLPADVESEAESLEAEAESRLEADVDDVDPSSAIPSISEIDSTSLSDEQVLELESLWEAIRHALSEHRLNEAAVHFSRARALARQPEQQARLKRWEQLSGLLSEFRVAVERAMQSMDPGTSFPISATNEVVVVERLPDEIIIRTAGKNYKFPLTELPLALGKGLAERGLPAGPRAKVVLGAFQAIHPRASPTHREMTRQWWLEAVEEGEDLTDLLPILDEIK